MKSSKKITKENVIKSINDYLELKKITSAQDFHLHGNFNELTSKFISRTLIEKFFDDTPQAVETLLNNGCLYPWLCQGQVPEGYWRVKNNRIKYMLWKFAELELTCYEDWYKVTAKQFHKNK